MGKLATVTRRTFLIGSVAVAGGVAFGIWKYRQPYDNPLLEELADGQTRMTMVSVFGTPEDFEGMIATDMESDARETWDRLAALLAREVAHE